MVGVAILCYFLFIFWPTIVSEGRLVMALPFATKRDITFGGICARVGQRFHVWLLVLSYMPFIFMGAFSSIQNCHFKFFNHRGKYLIWYFP